MVLKILTKCCPIPHTIFELCPKYKVVSSGGGGVLPYVCIVGICAARETPIFSPEFPFRSISLSQITKIPEHHHFTFFGGFCRSGGHHFQNFFNFNPFIASHGRAGQLNKICPMGIYTVHPLFTKHDPYFAKHNNVFQYQTFHSIITGYNNRALFCYFRAKHASKLIEKG